MKTNILVLLAGQSDHKCQDSNFPFYLSEMEVIFLLKKIVTNTCEISSVSYTFALLDKNIERFYLDKIACLVTPTATVIRTLEGTRGSAPIALLAASQFEQDTSLLIVDANEPVDINFSEVVNNFRRRNLDAGALAFRSVHLCCSYVCLNDKNLVTKVKQQDLIIHHTTNVFWFARVQDFVESTKSLIRKNANAEGKFYIALTLNELILQQARVGVYEIDLHKYKALKPACQISGYVRV
ncbi:MAG: hypothetical protein WCB98_01895 [Candidatus Aquirickettsiella gammari]|jgi:hypothetical protein